MAVYKGVQLASSLALPAGLDGSRIAIDASRGGISLTQLVGDVNAALQGVSAEVMDAFGDLIHITPEDHLEYPSGGDPGRMTKVSELDTVDSTYATTVGHHIDLQPYKSRYTIGEIALMDLPLPRIQANIRMHTEKVRNTFEYEVFNRAFLNTSTALLPGGYAAPFANASNGFTFAPPAFGGQTFATTHTHYVGYNSSASATLASLLDGGAAHLSEHGHQAPYTAYVAEADVATYAALTNFIAYVAPVIQTIDRAGATSGAQYFANGIVQATQPSGGRTIGWYQSNYGPVELRATYRIPTKYVFMYKSYGYNSPKNPLYVRIRPAVGFGVRMYVEPHADPLYQIKSMEMRMEFGVAAGMDRTAGFAGFLATGNTTYVAPTIS